MLSFNPFYGTGIKMLVLLVLIGAVSAQQPVFLWPESKFKTERPVLETLYLSDFENLINNQDLVVFVRKSLTIEDISQSLEPLPYLSSQQLLTLPSVAGTEFWIENLNPSKHKVIRLSGNKFSDDEEIIKTNMLKNPGFSAILLGETVPENYVMDFESLGDYYMDDYDYDLDNISFPLKYNDSCLMLYLENLHVNGLENTTERINIANCSADYARIIFYVNATSHSALDDDFGFAENLTEVALHFRNESSAYTFDVTIDGLNTTLGIDTPYAPSSFSYSCGTFTVFVRNAKKEIIMNATFSRFQAWMNPTEVRFPQSFDCATLFTTPIWAGLVVVLFYLIIIFMTLMMLFNVSGNDHYEDPKGKTITVVAED